MDEIDQSVLDDRLRMHLARLRLRLNNAVDRMNNAIALKAPAIIIGMCEDRLLCYQKQLLEFIAPDLEEIP